MILAGFLGPARAECHRAVEAGAFSQRFTYSTTHGLSVLAWTALTMRSWSTESKNWATSRSRTQFLFWHRRRQVSAGMRGWAVTCWVPMVMVADRSGRRDFTILLMLRPERAWASREMARAANTTVRWAWMLSCRRWKIGRAARSDLVIRKDRSTW